MKKTLLVLSLALANLAWAQFSSGTVNLPNTAMTVKLDTTPAGVTITVTGDSNSMLGIGFGSVGMGAGSDGFIYNSSTNRDYGFTGPMIPPTVDPSQDWTETSNTISGSTRTVIATRSLSGGAGDLAIANAAGTINIFYARKTGTGIGYHDAGRGYATLTMTAASLSTNEIAANSKKVSLYPNPAKSTVNFKNSDKIKSVDIFEASGRKVLSVKPDGESISVENLRSGSYYLEIQLKDGTTSYEKLIKE
ncbi:T9SS type A sorting domain-containing protein [Chryseobacterium sp. JV558]|uniref:T9SS type A sorting domain-containing protein n=1 Tax=Chryseobacterium sp. JV558 TaxID=2663236 RepID=UPI00299F52B9|nr:T9SS type A sorting domain-containing protein [Chryseobacterium sp. JV558]MDW9379896.1 T9SS type A sorting domain-containing protein [Chryseobacterium sp. JV558]